MSFHIHREELPPQQPLEPTLEVETSLANDEEHLSLLQQHAQRQVLQLANHVEPPRFTFVDCQHVLFLPAQLCQGLQPDVDLHSVWWHASTWYHSAWVPLWTTERALGLTFSTDGSARRSFDTAAAGVFLIVIVHTDAGLRCGGFLTTPCLGPATAPRAEASALVLAALWIQQLVSKFAGDMPWFEIAYDCEHTANIAQGHKAARCNSDLHVVNGWRC